MGAQQQQRKLLRIGIIQGGRIIEERLIKSGESVTIGDGKKNTFVLHSSGLPNRFTMFVAKGPQYSLAFSDDMEGKLSVEGTVMGLDGVRVKSVRQKDGTYHFPLNERIRGKVAIANTTILFQFVPPPPTPPKGAQRELAYSWFREMDSTYWGIFALSAVIHTVLILYAMNLPVPAPMTLEDMPNRFARLIVPPKVAPPPEVPKDDAGDKKEEEPKEEKKEEKKAEKKDVKKEAEPVSAEEAKKQKREQLAKKGILAVLGTKFKNEGIGGFGAVVQSSGAESASLETLMRTDPGAFTAAGGTGGLQKGKADGGLVGVDGDVGAIGGDADVKVAKRKKQSVPQVQASAPEVSGGDATSIEQTISKYKGSVNACYETALKLNPTIKGKLIIDFTVEPTGRVSNVSFRKSGFSDESMERCIREKVVRWRFKADSDIPVDVALPMVFTPG